MLKSTESATNGDRDYSHFDQMGTDKLKEILRLHALSPNDDADTQAMLYIMEVIAHRENLQETFDVNLAWKSFQENYQPYASEFSLYDDEETREDIEIDEKPPNRITKHVRVRQRRVFRVAYITVALALLLFATTITAVALGYDIWGGIAQWGRDTFGFQSIETSTPESLKNSDRKLAAYDNLQTALEAHGISETVAPRWLPDGFVLEDLKVHSEMRTSISFNAAYTNEEQFVIIAITLLFNEPYGTLEKDEGDVQAYEKGGIEHYIMTNNGQNIVAWMNGNLECRIAGDISRDELIRIVDSIYER